MPARPRPPSAVADLIGLMQDEADPGDAEILARYFKTGPGGYGEGDVFLGIKLSRLRTILKPHRTVPFVPAEWLPLLHSPIHEHRLACLVIMAERAQRAAAAERAELYGTYLANTAQINNWDLVDVSAAAVVGGYLMDRDRGILYRLARSPLVWDRRIAVISTHRFIRAGQSGDIYALALRLRDDDHDLIHKAVGWMLREAGRRVSREELLAFLDQHAASLPRVTLRYAIEHLGPEQRAHYRQLRPGTIGE
ncbi:MAG TPA: DNA alkylation repair protein [Microlunatus sp.]